MKCKQINFSVDNISLLVSFGDKSSDRTLAYCSALLLHEKAKIMNDMNASESVAAHAGFSFPDLQVIFAGLMLFSRRSCMMTRISYSHDGSHPTYGATYRMWFRLPIPNPNPNPNPKTDPNPNRNCKSNNNLCSAKRHPNKVQDSVINTGYFIGQGLGRKRPITAKRVPLTI